MSGKPERPSGGPTQPVELDLTVVDGNAFFIIAAVCRALRRAGATSEYLDAVRADMMSSDYDHVLRVAIGETSG